MDNITYLACRSQMRKQASGAALLKGTVDVIKNSAKFLAGNLASSAKYAFPAGGLLAAWLAYKTMSPKAVADSASEYAMNATEKESVVQSIRDLQEAEAEAKLKGGRRRPHDQFL